MSSFLFSLGRRCYDLGWRIIAAWFVVIALAAGAALAFGEGTNDTIHIPGVESQEALEDLARVFPAAAGASAQVVVDLPEDADLDDPGIADDVDAAVQRFSEVEQIDSVTSPYDGMVDGSISDDGSTAIIVAQYSVQMFDVTDDSRDGLEAVAADLQEELPAGAQVHLGGEAFTDNVPSPSATEAVGVVLALVFLFLLFRSVKTAVVPLLTALVGVAATELLIQAATGSVDIMATAPMLALMLGLAVGIDYALFIVSRYRDELRDGVAPPRAAAVATATAGSAVVFAGVTVIIALVGLFVARIPFLTIMGLAAALGVAMAIMVAVTAIPAILRYLGHAPLGRRRPRRKATTTAPAAPAAPAGPSVGERWVTLVTRHPVVTLTVSVVAVVLMALPALGLQLALPDNGSEPRGNTARDTYDLISEEFGEGANGPLIVTVDLLDSLDPIGDMDRLGDDLGRTPGVDTIAMSTPEPSGSLGIVQVIPTSAPDSPETAELVERLREQAERVEAQYPVSELRVTGITAVQVDVSDTLSASILPFGVFVFGLSIVLLIMVFRSVIVPLKAALGYVLSLAAALGITTLVFVHGVGADLLGVTRTGSIVAFLPIILMAVLFGLAMDYEVFLVSRIAEARHRIGDARAAIRSGFTQSAPVVTVAALIMIGVFVAFVPDDDATIKPIALALSVGVTVDAFLVRMTMVPAVLQLLGERAWRLPPALARRMPTFDVEGVGIERQLALQEWEPGAVVAARDLVLDDDEGTALAHLPALRAGSGQVAVVTGGGALERRAMLLALSGRLSPFGGDVNSAGYVLPGQAWRARRVLPLLGASRARELGAVLASRPPVVFVDDLAAVVAGGGPGVAAIREAVDAGVAIVTTAADGDALRDLLGDGVTAWPLAAPDPGPDQPDPSPRLQTAEGSAHR
ncbi:MAG TPA: MMPL family transporter [Candidatus Dietzia intestinipullorum]|nr:MMPL family transporter [Candidatus Dietzia merdigallinarum]HJC28746.1 MMPL family transporter [Candidatus Dietzia intestinipullorum]